MLNACAYKLRFFANCCSGKFSTTKHWHVATLWRSHKGRELFCQLWMCTVRVVLESTLCMRLKWVICLIASCRVWLGTDSCLNPPGHLVSLAGPITPAVANEVNTYGMGSYEHMHECMHCVCTRPKADGSCTLSYVVWCFNGVTHASFKKTSQETSWLFKTNDPF